MGDVNETIGAGPTRRTALVGGVFGMASLSTGLARAAPGFTDPRVRHGIAQADGVDVFYREAGPAGAPVLLLLHGFANSSFYFRHLMPSLADRFRLVAPDLPSFGFTAVPPGRRYTYDFASLSRTIEAFVDVVRLDRYVLYMFDYGAPIGFDLALSQPDRVAGVISQNGNAYVEGLAEAAWAPLRAYWASPSFEKGEVLRARMTLDGVKDAYFHGVADTARIAPETYTLDAAVLARPGNADTQIALKLDYKRNIDRYPLYQAFLRERRPPTLAVWGRNDPFFVPAGAEAFRRDVPDAGVTLLDAGHFVLETDGEAVADEIRRFF